MIGIVTPKHSVLFCEIKHRGLNQSNVFQIPGVLKFICWLYILFALNSFLEGQSELLEPDLPVK